LQRAAAEALQTRKKINMGKEVARPHRKELAVNSTTQIMKNRLRPNSMENQPPMGRMMAFETR
jgi:hypothetical protein